MREGSFIATVDVADPNAVGIAQNFVARVSRGSTSLAYCVDRGGVVTCYPDMPLWLLMGIIGLSICALVLLIFIIVCIVRLCKNRKSQPPRMARDQSTGREILVRFFFFFFCLCSFVSEKTIFRCMTLMTTA